MKFQPHFLRITTLPTAGLLLIIWCSANGPVWAKGLKAESDAERYVLEQVKKGEVADLTERSRYTNTSRVTKVVRASFIAALLTNRDARFKIHPHEIQIYGVVIAGNLDLHSEEIPYNVDIQNCIFQGPVNFIGSKFAKNLVLSFSTFEQGASLDDATIDSDFIAEGSRFPSTPSTMDFVSFRLMQVGRDFDISRAGFYARASFDNMRVGGVFSADESHFDSRISLREMRVEGSFSVSHCTFASWADFTGARFGDAFFDDCSFGRFQKIDFTRMQADSISFEDVKASPETELILYRMTFKTLTPLNLNKIEFLLARSDPEFFTILEDSFRTHGHSDDADEIFIARKRAERSENCKQFLGQCNRGAWAWSLFQDMLAGYGKRLQNLLYWSLGFLVIGTFVFRSEKGMRPKDQKDVRHYRGTYHAFWYSLDLFLPIIKLGEAETWTPKDNRRWAILYKKVHIVIGSLFVPIGLAAWTGIIK